MTFANFAISGMGMILGAYGIVRNFRLRRRYGKWIDPYDVWGLVVFYVLAWGWLTAYALDYDLPTAVDIAAGAVCIGLLVGFPVRGLLMLRRLKAEMRTASNVRPPDDSTP